jgi:hypothetical protein
MDGFGRRLYEWAVTGLERAPFPSFLSDQYSMNFPQLFKIIG